MEPGRPDSGTVSVDDWPCLLGPCFPHLETGITDPGLTNLVVRG